MQQNMINFILHVAAILLSSNYTRRKLNWRCVFSCGWSVTVPDPVLCVTMKLIAFSLSIFPLLYLRRVSVSAHGELYRAIKRDVRSNQREQCLLYAMPLNYNPVKIWKEAPISRLPTETSVQHEGCYCQRRCPYESSLSVSVFPPRILMYVTDLLRETKKFDRGTFWVRIWTGTPTILIAIFMLFSVPPGESRDNTSGHARSITHPFQLIIDKWS
jgi:hypothetical protein